MKFETVEEVQYKHTFKAWAEAFEIFAKYNTYSAIVGSEYQLIEVMVNPTKVSKEDRNRLDELKWTQSIGSESFIKYL